MGVTSLLKYYIIIYITHSIYTLYSINSLLVILWENYKEKRFD